MSTVGAICNVLGWIRERLQKFLQEGEFYSQENPQNLLLYIIFPLCWWMLIYMS